MENKELFGELTPRMLEFRESVLNEKPYVDAERAVLVTEAYRANEAQPYVIKRARGLEHILANMTIYIEPQTLIVGNQATKNYNAPVFPEYTMGFIIDELDKFELRDGDRFYISDVDKQRLRELAPYWKNNCQHDHGIALLPDEVLNVLPSLGMEGKLNAGPAHIAVNYERLLREGLVGYEQRTRQLKRDLDLTDPASIDKYQFYKAVLIVIDAVKHFADRYAKLADELASKETDPNRRA